MWRQEERKGGRFYVEKEWGVGREIHSGIFWSIFTLLTFDFSNFFLYFNKKTIEYPIFFNNIFTE